MKGRRSGGVSARTSIAADPRVDAREAMIGRARQLLDEVQVEMPPVDLRMVSSFRGVRDIQSVPMLSAGRLVPAGGGFIIQVNRDHSPGRQRFSAAHEIGHILLPDYQRHPSLIDDMQTGTYDESREAEYLCDLAAAELLMPMKLFAPAAMEAGFGLDAASQLATAFQASREAAVIRLVQTGLWPCAVAVWHFAHKPSEHPATQQATLPSMEWASPQKKLRVRYAVASPGFGYFLPRHLSADPEGHLARCFATGSVVTGEEEVELRNVRVVFSVAAAPLDVPGESGLERRVVSLLLSDGPFTAGLARQPAFWSLSGD